MRVLVKKAEVERSFEAMMPVQVAERARFASILRRWVPCSMFIKQGGWAAGEKLLFLCSLNAPLRITWSESTLPLPPSLSISWDMSDSKEQAIGRNSKSYGLRALDYKDYPSKLHSILS
jgi:hypothetical protein